MSEETDLIEARRIAVLADCHIHPEKGLGWPEGTLEALDGAELIVTLGDMGERAGLDDLAAIAPVIGVKGNDDEEDARTAVAVRVLKAGPVRIGCVFNAAKAGLAADGAPPLQVSEEALVQAFGEPVDVLLWGATHASAMAQSDRLLSVNPGSATLPAEGAKRSFAWLTLGEGGPTAEIVSL